MDDLAYGTRDKRGNWKPDRHLKIAPIWALPPKLGEVLRWLPGYFLPWNLIFMAITLGYWAWVIPPVETMRVLSWGWVLWLFAVNVVAVCLWYGAFEFRLYWQRAQGTRFKYNPKFPSEHKDDAFWFGHQVIDNVLRTILSGVTLWTAFQVAFLWVFANGWVAWVGFADSPVYLVALWLLVPVIHQLHFYCIHRLIHVPVLYKWVHSVHHNSVNPSPWSSLAMHPVEHALYFASAFWHLVIPSNPVLALYQLHYAGFGAVPGHVGFDRMEVSDGMSVDAHAYGHYLHHKYFEVNYGDGLVPLDKVFGTFHDGSEAADAQMQERFVKKKARMAAGRPTG
ncbi:MAG: sterol desaturase family protein [Silicimonas sp.]|nr:sterol desaturase family protein [Silicimonas sp.]